MATAPGHATNERVRSHAGRLGGTAGNESLTRAAAAVLVLLLAAEGVTIIDLHGLRTPHMFVGLVLLGPLAVKLGSTGYRFARYYAGTRPYREKGPPALALRLLAPLLVAATLTVFASGIALLITGHRSDLLLLIHKASFIAWSAVFAAHFLAYLPRVLRTLGADWGARRRRELPGSALRLAVLLTSLAGGLALGLAFLGSITGWHGR
jgi:hypothetical protein